MTGLQEHFEDEWGFDHCGVLSAGKRNFARKVLPFNLLGEVAQKAAGSASGGLLPS
jgi:hypothetical protein